MPTIITGERAFIEYEFTDCLSQQLKTSEIVYDRHV